MARARKAAAAQVPAEQISRAARFDTLIESLAAASIDNARSVAREAAKVAASFIARGYSVDLGLMQVNSRNLVTLGLTLQQVLDPCTNIRSGATILTADYAEAARTRGEGQPALQAALSAYNTGDFYRGFANGYVAHYYGAGGVPGLTLSEREAIASSKMAIPATAPRPVNPFTADTSVFTRETANVRIE